MVTRPGDEVAPPAVTGLTAQALEYGVRLQWHASTAADLAEYRIYEQPADFDTPQYVGTVDATRTYATLRMAADGEQKRYVVLAADRWGNVASYVGDPEGDGTYWDQPVAAAKVTELDLRPTAQAPRTRPATWTPSPWPRAPCRWTRTATARASRRRTATRSTAGTA